MARLLPFIFVVLWASAFVSSKIIVADATPFAALSLRYAIVTAGFLLVAAIWRENLRAAPGDIGTAGVIGVLFHGISIGSVFFAVSVGLPAGIAALINSIHPILTNALAGPLLAERVSLRQWIGIVLGFSGVVIVLGLDIGADLPTLGVAAAAAGLFALSAATLWQKKRANRLPLTVTNFYQAAAGSLFHLAVMALIETPTITVTLPFVMSLGWQIVAISFGAFTILLILLKSGSASQTSALFFLVPPVSILMAWVLLGETLSAIDLLGLAIATVGVYLATRGTPAG